MIWISNPVFKINGQFRIVKYTHKLPMEQTNVIISKEKSIPTLFKDRKAAELAGENLVNPYEMTNSLNLTFDSSNEYDTTLSSDVKVEEGNLKTTGGALGTMISNNRSSDTDITHVHIKAIGDALSGTVYHISTDNGDTYETVALETETVLTTAGKNLRLKVVLNSASTLLDSIAVLYR